MFFRRVQPVTPGTNLLIAAGFESSQAMGWMNIFRSNVSRFSILLLVVMATNGYNLIARPNTFQHWGLMSEVPSQIQTHQTKGFVDLLLILMVPPNKLFKLIIAFHGKHLLRSYIYLYTLHIPSWHSSPNLAGFTRAMAGLPHVVYPKEKGLESSPFDWTVLEKQDPRLEEPQRAKMSKVYIYISRERERYIYIFTWYK